MITQELIAYIKSELAKGQLKESLKKNLILNGWQDSDIEEGFRAIAPQVNVPKPSNDNFSSTVVNQNITSEQVKKEVPVGIQILGILYYLTAILGLLGIIFGFVTTFLINKAISMPGLGFGLGGLVSLLFIPGTLIAYFLARGLYKGRNWVRILLIILGILGLICGIIALFSAFQISILVPILINVLVTSYLLFNKKVKEFFAQNQPHSNRSFFVIIIVLMIVVGGVFVYIKYMSNLNEPPKNYNELPYLENTPPIDNTSEVVVQENPAVAPAVTNNDSEVCGTEESLKIISPQSGTVTRGDQMTVVWKSCNIPESETLVIAMVPTDPDAPESVIKMPKNTGSHTFEFSSAWPGSSHLRIYKFHDKSVFDDSDNLITVN